MGYTHYWYRPEVLSTESFATFSEMCRKIVDASNIPIAGGAGDGEPTINAEEIRFNGAGEDSCETFYIPITQTRDFAFCKTRYNSYDPVVCACLVAFKMVFGKTVRVSSDGDKSDWSEGVQLFNKVFNENAKYSHSEEDDGINFF